MAKTETRPWDAAEYLRDDADMVAYLEAALEDGDPTPVPTLQSNAAQFDRSH